MKDISGLPNVDAPTANLINGVMNDVATPGDGTGTPVRVDWMSDLYYALIAVMNEASITADNTPEGATSSQFLDAVKAVAYAENLKAVPIGTIAMYAKATAPTNYYICDGTEKNRITDAALFAVIGTSYGVGDGVNTFNLPNYNAVVPKGVGNQTINARVKSGPAFATVQEDQIQGHFHNIVKYIGSSGGSDAVMTSIGQSAAAAGLSSLPIEDISNGYGVPRTGLTTRDNTIGTNFIIRYQ
jgi:microcystin-dependent protein